MHGPSERSATLWGRIQTEVKSGIVPKEHAPLVARFAMVDFAASASGNASGSS